MSKPQCHSSRWSVALLPSLFEARVIKIVLRLASYLPLRLIKKNPRTLVRKVWIVATNLPTQIRMFQVLSRPGFEEFIRRFPSSAYKHTEENDLARSLTWAQRASCHLHHYGFLHAIFLPPFLRQVLNSQVRLFERTEHGHTFVIDMAAALDGYVEGELRLSFLADGVEIFDLSFTFISGSVVGSQAQNAILISCIQGTWGAQPVIAAAAKALQGVSPQALLVSAIEGIAQAVGIPVVASVSAFNQSTYTESVKPILQQRYDEFFDAWGATLLNPGFYCLPVPFPRKPMHLVRLDHRPRSRKRRALKSFVAEQARLALLPGIPANPLPSNAAKNSPQSNVCLDS
jgi:uncharacterized protein